MRKHYYTRFLLITVTVLFGPEILAQQTVNTKEDSVKAPPLISMSPDTISTIEDSLKTENFHPQDIPENRGFFIRTTKGDAMLRFTGSLRVNGAFDLNGLQDKDFFDTYEIPVGEENTNEPRIFLRASQSRFGFEMEKSTKFGLAYFRIEGDFLGNESVFRLRHAYGILGNFLIGKTWTTFSDVSALPLTVDFEGPNSAIALRTTQVRYRIGIKDHFSISVAVETPNPQFTGPDSLISIFQSIPNIALRVRSTGNFGHVQLAGIYRNVAIGDKGDFQYALHSYGFLLTGNLNLHPRHKLMFQGVAGKGISTYINSLSGNGLDFIYNPDTGEMEPLTSFGGYLSYKVFWMPSLFSHITYGRIEVWNKDFQPEDAFRRSHYISGNIFTDITDGIRIGVEYSHGERINNDLQEGRANRISFIFYYNF